MSKNKDETLNSKDLEFEKYLEKIDNPNYDNSDFSWDLAKNPTPLQKVKHQICEAILNFQIEQ